jgi:hypothetical protein
MDERLDTEIPSLIRPQRRRKGFRNGVRWSMESPMPYEPGYLMR